MLKFGILDKAKSLNMIAADLTKFYKGTRDVHLLLKGWSPAWAREHKALTTGLREDAIRMGEGIEDNYNEAKKLRRVLVGDADASVRVMEASFAVATRREGGHSRTGAPASHQAGRSLQEEVPV